MIKISVVQKEVLDYYFFNWDSFHARLNSHYEAWSYKKKKHKKIRAHRKSVQKEPTVKRCLLILDLKPLRSQVKGKHSVGREFQSLAVRGSRGQLCDSRAQLCELPLLNVWYDVCSNENLFEICCPQTSRAKNCVSFFKSPREHF